MNPDLTGKSIAIVGNAPHALSNKTPIDAFDFVVRCNHFTLGRGFEALGTRTDALAIPACHTAALLPELQRFTRDTGYVLDVATDPALGKENYPAIRELLPQASIIDSSHLTNPLRLELCEGIPAVRPTGAEKLIPSTGISAVAWALQTGAREIYLTGFSFEGDAKGHYFAPGAPMSRCHHFLCELRWLAERRDHPGLRLDDHIARRVELWRSACASLGSVDRAHWSLSFGD